jgi:hypothetical protein
MTHKNIFLCTYIHRFFLIIYVTVNLNNQKGSELPRVIALKIRITDLFNNEFIYKHMQIIQENCVMKIFGYV